jgi:hypothetical protein
MILRELSGLWAPYGTTLHPYLAPKMQHTQRTSRQNSRHGVVRRDGLDSLSYLCFIIAYSHSYSRVLPTVVDLRFLRMTILRLSLLSYSYRFERPVSNYGILM